MWQKKKKKVSKVIYACPECGKQRILNTFCFGQYAQCANGCFASFKRVPHSVEICQWHPGLMQPAKNLEGDDDITWHEGCEHAAKVHVKYKKETLHVCLACAKMIESKKPNEAIIDAYQNAKRIWNENRVLPRGSRTDGFKMALLTYRQACGYEARENSINTQAVARSLNAHIVSAIGLENTDLVLLLNHIRKGLPLDAQSECWAGNLHLRGKI